MPLKMQVDPKEFIKFVRENNKLDSYELGKKYGMSMSSMGRFLRKHGFIRVRTSDGLRYMLESEIIVNKNSDKQPQSTTTFPKESFSYRSDPLFGDDMLEYQFYSKEDVARLRIAFNVKMIALSNELKEINNEVNKKGYSDKVSQIKTEKIILEVPLGAFTTFNSARLVLASKFADSKPVEQWTSDECLKFMTLENFIVSHIYKYSINVLMKHDPESIKVIPSAEGYKKYHSDNKGN